MLSNVVRVAIRRSPARLMAVRNYSEGATGAPRGEQAGDSFTKREKAQEELYVRQLEKEKLQKLREALKKQREHLDVIESHIEELEKK
ncbi:mitochondrial ATPase inhibitor, IATP-domain-containing protein [Lipomyces arxii]|uniref:mitochondrial ATPase inhibitor, IATP-domain-containing protein n=1 Tax=Lipomyces arxii TaxID=56418 RepID=UPI0034CEE8FA